MFEESFEVKIQAVSKGGEVNMFICQLFPSFYFRFWVFKFHLHLQTLYGTEWPLID